MNSLTEFSKPLFWKVMKRNRSFDTGTDHTHQQPPFITGLQIFIIQSILEYYGTYPLLHSNRGSALSNCKDLHPNYISITTKRCFLYLLYFLQFFSKFEMQVNFHQEQNQILGWFLTLKIFTSKRLWFSHVTLLLWSTSKNFKI